MRNNRIYLDYAATTPVAPEVLEVMQPYFSEKFGNPGSLHTFGQEAQGAVDAARNRIAGSLGAESKEIIFTASATEANNLAIRGIVRGSAASSSEPRFARSSGSRPLDLAPAAPLRGDQARRRSALSSELAALPHIVTTVIEHESVLETCRDLERKKEAEVTYLPVTAEGVLRLSDVAQALRKETVLVSVGYANNEIGTIQPIPEIAAAISEFKIQNSKVKNNYPLFHTDAVQAVQFLDCDVQKLGVDLMTVSSHKIYGPKGIAALSVRHIAKLASIITGGGQEFGLRSGTENVPALVGFSRALELVEGLRERESARIGRLRDMLYSGILAAVPAAALNGAKEPRVPNNLNLSFPDYFGEELLLVLDREGIAVSTGSACRAKSREPSHVLSALGLPEERVRSSIRFSLGRFTTEEEIEKTVRTISYIFKK